LFIVQNIFFVLLWLLL